MIVSVFFLAAAADCIVLACKRFVRARTIGVRPSGVWVAVTVVLGTLCYWTFRSIENADTVEQTHVSLTARRGAALD